MSDGEGGAAELHGGPDPAIDGGRAGPAVTMYTMRQAFLEFLDAEYHLVVRFMMRNGAGLCEAEDATQEAFTRGWRKVARGQWPEGHPPPRLDPYGRAQPLPQATAGRRGLR